MLDEKMYKCTLIVRAQLQARPLALFHVHIPPPADDRRLVAEVAAVGTVWSEGRPIGSNHFDRHFAVGRDEGGPPGTIIEFLSTATGSGSETLAMVVAGHVMGAGGVCIVIDRQGSFYPPAATLWIKDLARMLVVRPQSDRDAVWALEQSLRCSGVAVVVCRLEKLSQQAWRRLQLAGETGGGIGLLLRSAQQRGQLSWAGVRLLVEPLPPGGSDREVSVVGEQEWSPGRRMRIELIHCRGRTQEESVELEIDDETGDVHLAPAVAPAAHRLRASS
jgi:protein ImuA